MTRFAIFVTVRIKPGTRDAFLPLILENATAAVRDEPDCHQFRVMNTEDDPDTFHFFEVYTDARALDRHRETPHFKAFFEASADMIEERVVQRLDVIQ